jgi:hypothetical protein
MTGDADGHDHGQHVHSAWRLGDMRKIVASRSPLKFTWRNSEQLQGDLVETVTTLKNGPAIGSDRPRPRLCARV